MSRTSKPTHAEDHGFSPHATAAANAAAFKAAYAVAEADSRILRVAPGQFPMEPIVLNGSVSVYGGGTILQFEGGPNDAAIWIRGHDDQGYCRSAGLWDRINVHATQDMYHAFVLDGNETCQPSEWFLRNCKISVVDDAISWNRPILVRGHRRINAPEGNRGLVMDTVRIWGGLNCVYGVILTACRRAFLRNVTMDSSGAGHRFISNGYGTNPAQHNYDIHLSNCIFSQEIRFLNSYNCTAVGCRTVSQRADGAGHDTHQWAAIV